MSHHTGVEKGVGFVTSYRIGEDGSLAEVNTQSTGGRGDTCASFDRTGCFLLVTRYWDGGVTALRFDPQTGEIGDVTAKPDQSGQFLLVASQDADCVECFRIDSKSGELALAHIQPAPCPADVVVI